MTSSTRASVLAIAFTLAAATFVAFWPVRENGFVSFDDPRYITHNDQVTAGLTAHGIAWALTASEAYNWHPLTWISHMADVEAFGLDPAAHHLVSVAFHAANAVLLFALLRVSTGALAPSMLVAALFALHPLRVESVAWASERKDVLSATLWLVTMLLYVAYARRPSGGRYAAVAMSFAAGLMAKPMLVTLPFVLLLFDYWPLGRLRVSRSTADAVSAALPAGRRKARKAAGATSRRSGAREAVPISRLLAEKAPLLLLAVAAGSLTLRAQQGIVQSTEAFPIAARIANAFVSCAKYLAKLLWPVDLAVFYPYRARSFAEAETWAAVLVVVGLTSAAVMLRRRGYPIVGWLWFVGTLVPVLGLVQAGIQSMADRYTYVPGIGILIVVVWGAADLRRSLRVPAAAAVAGSMAVLVVLSALTWRQVEVWRDDESLFGHAARVTTGSYWAHYNLGLTLLNTGRGAEAVPEFEEAARVEPSSNEALENLGFALEAAGRIDDAAAAFERATRADESDLSAAQNWARVLVTHDRAAQALPVAGAALRRWPADAQLNYSIGLAHLFLDRPELAIDPLTRAIAANPGYAAAQNALGIVFARQGDRAAAIGHFKRALELEPTYQEARANLAMVEE